MNKKIWIVFIVTTLVLLALDLWLKYWAQNSLVDEFGRSQNRALFGNLLGLTYVRNTGAFFGFLGGFEWARIVLSVLKFLILGALVVYYAWLPREPKMWFLRVPILLIFVGGLGNLYDRLRFGYVRDMLDFTWWEGFAIFNLADVFVTTGVFALIVFVLFVVRDIPMPWEDKKKNDSIE